MTVALVLAAQPDAGLRGQLTALGVRRVDAAEQAGPGLLAVVAAARAAGERVLICAGDDGVPEEILARLLEAGGTAAFTGLRAPAARAASATVSRPGPVRSAASTRCTPSAASRPRSPASASSASTSATVMHASQRHAAVTHAQPYTL